MPKSAATTVKPIESLEDCIPDLENVNKGTERGNWQLEQSKSDVGDRWHNIIFRTCAECQIVFLSSTRNNPGCCSRSCASKRQRRIYPRPSKTLGDMKRCSKCKALLPATIEFFPSGGPKARTVGKLYCWCRECSRENHRVWAAANPDKHAKRHSREGSVNGGARSRGVVNSGILKAGDVERMYTLQFGMCAYCACDLGGRYHVDHVLPLAQGGGNELSNLCLACPECNQTKNKSTVTEFQKRCPSRISPTLFSPVFNNYGN